MELPKLKSAPNLKEIIAKDPLGEFFVWWMGFPLGYEENFEKCLSLANGESDLQQFFSSNPYVLAAQLGVTPFGRR